MTRPARLALSLVTLALICAGLAAQPLEDRIEQAIRSAGGSRTNAHWSILAIAMDSGETLASMRADEALKPGSSLKCLVAAAALDLLGPDHRIPTTVHAEGTRDGSTLRGNLWVLGLADPTYNGRHSDSASAALRNLADSIRSSGIRRVTGDLIITGLFVYADGRGATDVLGGGADVCVLSNYRGDRGRYTPTDVGTARIVGQDDFFREANLAAGRSLRSQLREIGVTIEGSVRQDSTLDPPGTVIARRLSPPLDSIVRRVLHSSINLHSDLLLLHLGAQMHGRLRLDAGISAARSWLARTGVSTDGLTMVDGSGLSHHNRMTARQLVAIQQWMDDSPAADAWWSALPTAGRSGTLAHRLGGTAAADNLTAKTGTLTGASSLSGVVRDVANGQRVAFAIIENTPYESAMSTSRARQVIDRVALVITEGVHVVDLPVTERFGSAPDSDWTPQRGVRFTSGIERNTPGGDGRAGRLTRTGPGQAMAVTGPEETRSVAVEAMVHLSYNTSVNESRSVPYQGIVVRADGDNFIRFVGDFDRDRTLKIHAHVDGRWVRLRTWTFPDDFPDPGGSGWHRMRLELRGDEITAYFDGQRLPGDPITTTLRRAGRCGIYAWHWGGSRSDTNLAHFDDFRIEELN